MNKNKPTRMDISTIWLPVPAPSHANYPTIYSLKPKFSLFFVVVVDFYRAVYVFISCGHVLAQCLRKQNNIISAANTLLSPAHFQLIFLQLQQSAQAHIRDALSLFCLTVYILFLKIYVLAMSTSLWILRQLSLHIRRLSNHVMFVAMLFTFIVVAFDLRYWFLCRCSVGLNVTITLRVYQNQGDRKKKKKKTCASYAKLKCRLFDSAKAWQ